MKNVEDFKRLIEAPILSADDKRYCRFLIARTMRLTLSNIELAKEYYDQLPKATMNSDRVVLSDKV